MARRYYSSTAVATTLSSGVSSGATSITVGSTSGFPTSYPFTLILDEGTASEEVVSATNVAGTTVTVTRGVDGTSAVSHSSGAAVKHGVSARDFDEPNAHVNTTTGSHGLDNSLWSVQTPTTFTPTWTNITVGNGTSTGSYVQVGDLVFVRASLVFGSTTAVSSSAAGLTVPVTPAAFQQSVCGAFRWLGGAATSGLFLRLDASTSAGTLWETEDTTQFDNAQHGGSSFVNASGNILSISGVYLAA